MGTVVADTKANVWISCTHHAYTELCSPVASAVIATAAMVDLVVPLHCKILTQSA